MDVWWNKLISELFFFRAVFNSLDASLPIIYILGAVPCFANFSCILIQAFVISLADLVFNGSAKIALLS